MASCIQVFVGRPNAPAHGDWVELDGCEAAVDAIASALPWTEDTEFIVSDSEGLPSEFIGKHGLADFDRIDEFLGLDSEEQALWEAALKGDDSVTFEQAQDRLISTGESLQDLKDNLQEAFMEGHGIDSSLWSYIDGDAIWRDADCSGEVFTECNGTWYHFSE